MNFRGETYALYEEDSRFKHCHYRCCGNLSPKTLQSVYGNSPLGWTKLKLQSYEPILLMASASFRSKNLAPAGCTSPSRARLFAPEEGSTLTRADSQDPAHFRKTRKQSKIVSLLSHSPQLVYHIPPMPITHTMQKNPRETPQHIST